MAEEPRDQTSRIGPNSGGRERHMHPETHPGNRGSLGSTLLSPSFTFIEDGERLPAAGVQAAGSYGKPWWDGEAGNGETGGDIARSEELVIKQLVNGGASSGVCLKHLLDEGGGHRIDVLEGRGRV